MAIHCNARDIKLGEINKKRVSILKCTCDGIFKKKEFTIGEREANAKKCPRCKREFYFWRKCTIGIETIEVFEVLL